MNEDREGPISLETRMAFVLVVYFVGLYLLADLVGSLLHAGSTPFYLLFALAFIVLQNLGGAALYESRLGVHWLAAGESPRLEQIVTSLAASAELPEPQIGCSKMESMNAFAFGRTHRDGRVCVTEKLLERVNDDELKAVVAHEISHIKSWDMTIISLLAVVPVMSKAMLEIPGRLFSATGWLGSRIILMLLGVVLQPMVWAVALALIPINWFSMVLLNYASRVRELHADREAVHLGVRPHQLASALYKISIAEVDWGEASRLKVARPLMLGTHETYAERSFLQRLDADRSGDVSETELATLRDRPSEVTLRDRVAELFSSHPIMHERFRKLARLA